MKLIVGLGNLGKSYSKNRHNIGFMVVDKLAKDHSWKTMKACRARVCKFKLGNESIKLIKPLTFMNNSGFSVSCVAKSEKKLDLSDIYVIHDDLDISLGKYKVDFGKGPREHKGVNSIEKCLKTRSFWRVRVGVENRGSKMIPGEAYVLRNFSKKELGVVDKIIPKIIKGLLARFESN
jgi:PTH1 family peptidyl-tRNA hydrolase